MTARRNLMCVLYGAHCHAHSYLVVSHSINSTKMDANSEVPYISCMVSFAYGHRPVCYTSPYTPTEPLLGAGTPLAYLGPPVTNAYRRRLFSFFSKLDLHFLLMLPVTMQAAVPWSTERCVALTRALYRCHQLLAHMPDLYIENKVCLHSAGLPC